ncbi:hypothetical protein ACHQM5_025542 [Ranunculus cassubicifolius]
MTLGNVFIFFTLLSMASSLTPPDLPAALTDMRTGSYYGFVIILNMMNDTITSSLGREVTFFMPSDNYLADFPVDPNELEEFILSQAIPGAIGFNELAHVPSGTVFPSLIRNRFLRISGRGRRFVNNAQIVAPNVCSTSTVRCHGIDAVITDEMNSVSTATVSQESKVTP